MTVGVQVPSARTIAYRSVKRFSFYRPFYFLFIGQITVRLGAPVLWKGLPFEKHSPEMFFFGNFARTIAYRSVKRFSFYRPFYFLFIGQNHGSPRAPVLWKGLPFEKHSPEMFFFGNFARTASEQVTLVPIFLFHKKSVTRFTVPPYSQRVTFTSATHLQAHS